MIMLAFWVGLAPSGKKIGRNGLCLVGPCRWFRQEPKPNEEDGPICQGVSGCPEVTVDLGKKAR